MTVTDRLIADLIAHLRSSSAGSLFDMDTYAAERLALAEQSAEKCPLCHGPLGNAHDGVCEVCFSERCGSEEMKRAFPAPPPKPCPLCDDLGAIRIHDGNRQGDPCPVCKPTAAPPRADWIEGAKQKAHAAAEAYGDSGDVPYSMFGTACALDAFIAAMPPQTPPEQQPEEVPSKVVSEALDAAENASTVQAGVIKAVRIGWNSARRYAPSPREVTEALRNLIDHIDRNTCEHESTHRGGTIWTICDECGRKWADDDGGFKPHEDAPAVAAARAALSSPKGE